MVYWSMLGHVQLRTMETKAAVCSCLFCGRVGILAPLLCARFSDLGLELSDETEHSSCARLSDLGLVPSDETEHSIVVLD